MSLDPQHEATYAQLADANSQITNQYGSPITLLPEGDQGRSLQINGSNEIGTNPNRTKQHAFHFTADNCIGCHACEAACSEKNDLAPHLSFRSVGYIESGTFPDYQRVNLSMACNHCDDPVCLKGCPTRAYTKHPEYGAVIQDPDICFGCGYCTWVCPYNAPQLDPMNGQVEKCNMCVDRLEVGLKPACVSACVGNALDFGVVENVPASREQTETQIPGFPDPEITKPNIRFQQTKALPLELTRTDSARVKYKKGADDQYQPTLDPKSSGKREWNWKKLISRENPLVVFTLLTQCAIGFFTLAVATNQLTDAVALVTCVLVGIGMLMSTKHLGKPLRFYRGFNNLRHSNLSREALATVLFGGSVGLHLLCSQIGLYTFGYVAIPCAVAVLYFMIRCYTIPARPFWNHWQTSTAFGGAALTTGSCLLLLIGNNTDPIIYIALILGVVTELIGLVFHARRNRSSNSEAAASHYEQSTTFAKTHVCRIVLMACVCISAAVTVLFGWFNVWIALILISLVFTAEFIGRSMFYVLVTPTTMPGAFFWRNKGFEEHARETGLADNPNVGVARISH
ncbi:MAG: dimethyl sulfoxide reductase anchor subunit [Gammaproteobacteria bacterium]|nr:dimethyl sulfoxide reductase anchor subunit [Gammaproteobacteria bacterium]